MKKLFSTFIIGAVFTALLFSSPTISAPKGGTRYDSSDKNEILDKKYYTISFRPKYGVAEWTMYETNHQNVISQNVKRYTGAFRTDPDVTIKINHNDYTRSGYDRGHMVPCNDMQWSASSMMSTFYMTNIAPQLHSFNTGIWKSLENLSEPLSERYESLWIITGPVINKPASQYKSLSTSRYKVIIPEYFYKIFFMFDSTDTPKVVAFLVPHNATDKDIKSYIVSVDKIESLTGLDFFSNFSEDVQNSFESGINTGIFN